MDYNNWALRDLEIKIHDARRQIEKLQAADRSGQTLPQDELEKLATNLVQALKYFYEIRDHELSIAEIDKETKTGNIIEIKFPKKGK